MPHIEIAPDVIAAFPEAEVRLIAAFGVDNTAPWEDANVLLAAKEAELAEQSWKPLTEPDPQIQSWHDAYRGFGVNPRRLRPSLDALSRRIAKSGVFPRINPAVDAYNYVSVVFGMPAGAFDLDEVAGRIDIRYATDGDVFAPLGQPEVAERPSSGEVVYVDEKRVLTRVWNYRDCDETKIQESTRNILFILERVSSAAVPDQVLDDAEDALAALLAPRATGVVRARLNGAQQHAVLGAE